MVENSLSFFSIVAWGIALLLLILVLWHFIKKILKKITESEEEQVFGFISDHLLLKGIRFLLKLIWVVAVLAYALLLLSSFAFSLPVVDFITSVFHKTALFVAYNFSRPLFNLGEQGVSIRFIIVLIMVFVLLSFATTTLRRYLKKLVLSRLDLDKGVQESLASVAGYIFLVIASLIAFDLLGIDLSMLAIIFGALSIGIGFGLQHIVNNFISGLILLIERPIKIGDRIDLGDIQGEVLKISARATLVKTNDNIDILIPNAEFVSGRVVNWSQREKKIRFRIPVGVAYGTDIDLAMKVMEEAGSSVAEVMSDPNPVACFVAFGDSSLALELRVWTEKRLHSRGRLVSDINVAIYKKFIEHNITIPFPQRDIYIKSWPEKNNEKNNSEH